MTGITEKEVCPTCGTELIYMTTTEMIQENPKLILAWIAAPSIMILLSIFWYALGFGYFSIIPIAGTVLYYLIMGWKDRRARIKAMRKRRMRLKP